MPKEQRRLYDTEKMSKDYRNVFFVWMLILGLGALLSYLITPYMAFPTFAVWLIMFVREIHLDEEKAFGKYKMQDH